jgi:hypothetical protein
MAKKEPTVHDETDSTSTDTETPEILAIESIDDVVETKHTADSHLTVTNQKNPLKRFAKWYWTRKLWTLPLTLLLIIAVLLAVPVTRYGLTSWFWKEPITIVATDATNGRPVSEAVVTVAGQSATTDSKGRVQLNSIAVGPQTVTITKKYYQTQTSNITVPWFAHGKEYANSMIATGRSVQINVTNRVSGKTVENALVSVVGENNQTRTDASGKATVILPADKKEVTATVTADGYNASQATLKQDVENAVQLVPAGKMYFLSKQSGKIDVVKTNFDGSDRQVVLAGTGLENDATTSLLASTDWKYLLLKSQREAGKPEVLTLISTNDDSTKVIDTGNAFFTLAGWSGHQFIYSLTRNDVDYWKPKRQAIKTLDADTGKIATVDENAGEGDTVYNAIYETLDNVYIVGDKLTYTKIWQATNHYIIGPDKQNVIMLVRSDGINKKMVKNFAAATNSALFGRVYHPNEIYYQTTTTDSGNASTTHYYELEDGSVKDMQNGADAFSKAYPAYLISPDAKQTFWSEARDGKNALFVGDDNGENGQQLALQSDYKAYGWFSNSYLLLQKNDSELYVTTKDQLKAGAQPLKISDYHKLIYGPTGYGSGYGGQ